MPSLSNRYLSAQAESNSVFETAIKQGLPAYTSRFSSLSPTSSIDFLPTMKKLKELVQTIARLAAEQDFKN